METPPTIQSPGRQSPPPPPGQTPGGEFAGRAMAFKDEAWLHIRRVLRGDFLTERATDAERARLASGRYPVTQPLAQDYAAWRKSVLWVAAVVMAIYACLELGTLKTVDSTMEEQTYKVLREQAKAHGVDLPSREDIRERLKQVRNAEGATDAQILIPQTIMKNAELLDGIVIIPKLAVVTGAFLMALAARSWADPRKSKKLSRLAWLIVFLTPFAITFLPITSMMDLDHIPKEPKGLHEQITKFVGPLFALQVFMMIGPKAIALFPGIIRSSMSLKTLLPESATPGWVMSIMGPMYALFLVVIMSTVNQVYGDILLIGGIMAFMVGSMIYALRAEKLVRPHTPEEVTSIVRNIRQQAAIANLVGAVLLGVFIFKIPELSFLDAFSFLAGVAATVLLLTIVASDFVVALMAKSFRQAQEFAGSAMESQLDSRYDALEAAQFTAIRAK